MSAASALPSCSFLKLVDVDETVLVRCVTRPVRAANKAPYIALAMQVTRGRFHNCTGYLFDVREYASRIVISDRNVMWATYAIVRNKAVTTSLERPQWLGMPITFSGCLECPLVAADGQPIDDLAVTAYGAYIDDSAVRSPYWM